MAESEFAEGRRRRLRAWLSRLVAWMTGLFIGLLLVLGLLAIPLACTTTITLPVPQADSIQVLLIDHGRTPSLVLPSGDGGYDRWVYGDWNYYALGNTGLHRGVMALFLPTQGGLGKERFDPPASIESIRRGLAPHAQAIHTLRVPADKATNLQGRLSSLFEANLDTLTPRPDSPLEFVHHPSTYTYFRNSNHTTAGWLRELGCRTDGPSFSSKWKVGERVSSDP